MRNRKHKHACEHTLSYVNLFMNMVMLWRQRRVAGCAPYAHGCMRVCNCEHASACVCATTLAKHIHTTCAAHELHPEHGRWRRFIAKYERHCVTNNYAATRGTALEHVHVAHVDVGYLLGGLGCSVVARVHVCFTFMFVFANTAKCACTI